ncbi:MAG: hypothetical protein F9K40_16360, partial [Kofleriaceae bacterium]
MTSPGAARSSTSSTDGRPSTGPGASGSYPSRSATIAAELTTGRRYEVGLTVPAFLPAPGTQDIVAPTVACVLVHTEVEGDRPTDHARAVLGEGRRIASSLGASLHAVAVIGADQEVPVGHTLIETLGRAGADRVLLVAAEKPAPILWSTIGAALVTACEQVQPSLALLASTAGGRDIAPRLAAHLG